MSDIAAAGIFGDWREHMCCVCCDDYCLLEADVPLALDLYRLTFDGVTYLTNRYIAVREDLLSDAGDVTNTTQATAWTVPAERAALSTQLLRAAFVHRLHDYGITVHEGGPEQRQHLYRDGEHVGWVMSVKWDGTNTMLLVDLPLIASVADNAPQIMPWTIFGSNDSWDIAAGLLNATRAFNGGWEA